MNDVCFRCTLSARLQPDVDIETAINAAHEWWDRECRPRPPKPKLSWACVPPGSVVKQDYVIFRLWSSTWQFQTAKLILH